MSETVDILIELLDKIEAMREEGENDLRTVLEYIEDAIEEAR